MWLQILPNTTIEIKKLFWLQLRPQDWLQDGEKKIEV